MNSKPSLLARLDGISLAALIVAMCSQIDVRHIGRDTLAEGLGYATKTLSLALSDVVFALVFLWFVARCVQLKAWKRLWWPPLPCWALIFALVLAAIHSPSVVGSVLEAHKPITKESKESIAEIIQFAGYFLVAPWIFVNLIRDGRDLQFVSRRKLAIGTFAGTASLAVLIALFQQARFETDLPRALFGSPNIYAAFLCLCIPLFAAYLVRPAPPKGKKFNQWVLLAVFLPLAPQMAVETIISVWAFLALMLGIFAALLLRIGQVTSDGKQPTGFIVLLIILFTSLSWSHSFGRQATQRADFLRVSSDHQKIKKQYIEWQAAIGWNVPRERAFATGVGPGNYQLNIGPLYSSLPNEEKMPPDSNNLYLVQAVSIGILGLGALLWVWSYFAGLALKAAKKWPDDWLGAGVLAALCSWAFVNLFHALIVRGAGLVLAFLFALAVVAFLGERNAAGENGSESANLMGV